MTDRDAVQTNIIRARIEQDVMFRSILKVIGKRNLHLGHFERSGERSYWGASVDKVTGRINGRNRLGILLMEASSRLNP